MRIPPIIGPAAQPDVVTVGFHVKRSFVRSPKRRTRARACHIGLPQKLWDRIVLVMFTCSLFIFLHALLGFGAIDEDLRASKDPSVLPNATLSISSPRNQGQSASSGEKETIGRGVMVDWHGDYGFLPSATSPLVSPALIPQDAFPDPTPALVGAGHRRAFDERAASTITRPKAPVNTPFMFDGTPYDPFRLEFQDSVDEGEVRGLYPIAEPSRTAPQGTRTRRFGRCFPGEACL